MCPPFPLGSCPQSNRTPDLFSRDLHSAFFAQPPSYRARDEHVFACDPSYCASHRFASELKHCDTTLRTSKNTTCLFHKFMASSRVFPGSATLQRGFSRGGQAFAAAHAIERSHPVQTDSRACVLCQRNILGNKPPLRGFDRPRKRACLTATLNFFLTRSDGTTAAERFFAQKPRSMFAAIVPSVALPPAPLRPPRRAEAENGGGQSGRYRDQGLSFVGGFASAIEPALLWLWGL
jgi:hypothetical protein